MTQHTSRLCKGYLTKKESDGVLHQMTWPSISPDLNPSEMTWDELDLRLKEKQPTSAQHVGTPSTLLEKHSLWSWLRECQECSKLRLATLKNLKYMYLFNTWKPPEWVNVQTFDWYCLYKLSKKIETSLFQVHVFQRYFVKIQITSQIFMVKGLNTVFHACSMNHKQLMNMHLWNGR